MPPKQSSRTTIIRFPLNERLDMARQHRVSEPGAADAKLRKMSAMPLSTFFCGCPAECKSVIAPLTGLPVADSFSELCSQLTNAVYRAENAVQLPSNQSRTLPSGTLRRQKLYLALSKDFKLTEAITAAGLILVKAGPALANGAAHPDNSLHFLIHMSAQDYCSAVARLTGRDKYLDMPPEEDVPLWEWLDELVGSCMECRNNVVPPSPPIPGRASPLISPTQRQYVDAVLDVWETVILPFCEFFDDPSLLSVSAPADPLARFRLSQ